jgi:hypothetical protein
VSDWGRIDREALDRYITGNYGEDQLRYDGPEEDGPPEPFYCKEHETVWSPSLRRYVCDFCGHHMPDPDLD